MRSAPPTAVEYTAAGLYDAGALDAADRLELLEWLGSIGVGIDEMVAAARRGNLSGLAGDRRIVPGDRLGHDQAVALSGLAAEEFDSIATALGFAPIGADRRAARSTEVEFTADEVHVMQFFAGLAPMFSSEEAIGFMRVVGSSVGRFADAAVSLFLADVERRHLEAGDSELALARKVYDATGLLDGFTAHLDPVLRRQVLQAVERTREASVGEERLRYRYAVGFVDLVGFTELTAGMSAMDLGTFVREFEARALDATTQGGGRVVKLIGDEVMFVAADPNAACRVATALMDGVADDGTVGPRGGIAYGDVLVRGGDYYGPVVNLASRLVGEAVPAEVLTSVPLSEAAAQFDFAPAGRRMVKGFHDPVEVRSLVVPGA